MKEALSTSGLVEPDTDILDRLFTMFDASGEQWVYYNDFLAGVYSFSRKRTFVCTTYYMHVDSAIFCLHICEWMYVDE